MVVGLLVFVLDPQSGLFLPVVILGVAVFPVGKIGGRRAGGEGPDRPHRGVGVAEAWPLRKMSTNHHPLDTDGGRDVKMTTIPRLGRLHAQPKWEMFVQLIAR